MSTKFGTYEVVLSVGMLITGSANTIMTKWQDRSSAVGRPGDASHPFNHPGFQTLAMFCGEFLCVFGYYVALWREKKKADYKIETKSYPIWLFFFPTACDLTSTTIMNIGLLMTTASVYQMMRGAMVLFTALFSTLFLGRRLSFSQYLGLVLVITGITVVGAANVIFGGATGTGSNPLLGASLVFGAQIIVATQFVVEDKLIGKYEVPALLAVGSEGIWGVVILAVVLPILQFVNTPSGAPIEDTYDAMLQCANSWEILVANLGSVFTIAFFNFFGISVTKRLSATHRTTIDSCRTCIIWIVTLALGWETFIWLQLVGFVILVTGTFYYNEILPVPFEKNLRKILCDCCFPGAHDYMEIEDEPEEEASDFVDGMSPGQHVRSPMDHRLRYYTQLRLPAAKELPALVSQSLSSYRESLLRP